MIFLNVSRDREHGNCMYMYLEGLTLRLINAVK